MNGVWPINSVFHPILLLLIIIVELKQIILGEVSNKSITVITCVANDF